MPIRLLAVLSSFISSLIFCLVVLEIVQRGVLKTTTIIVNLSISSSSSISFLKIYYLFIFRQKWRKGVREGEKHQCVVASHTPPTGDLACNPGIFPDWESNWWPFGLQASTQSTEPHQPGLVLLVFISHIFLLSFLVYTYFEVFLVDWFFCHGEMAIFISALNFLCSEVF